MAPMLASVLAGFVALYRPLILHRLSGSVHRMFTNALKGTIKLKPIDLGQYLEFKPPLSLSIIPLHCVPLLILKQGCTNFRRIYDPPKNSMCQKGDIRGVPY